VRRRGRIADGLIVALKRYPPIHRAARRARFTLGHVAPPRWYEGIPGRIHFNDFMFDDASPAGVARYRQRALNVIGTIERCLEAAGGSFDEEERWLDFGCGYGRVIRFLVQRVMPERVYASDVVKEGVDFCCSEFGVHAVYSGSDLENVSLPPFDFIYAISVLSHLNEHNSAFFLQRLGESLVPNGIVLFTTHGQWSLEHPEWYGDEFRARRAQIAHAVAADGMCFLPYRHLGVTDYGVAWHSREYIEETVRELHGGALQPLLFEPRGLDDHQDVFAFRRGG
jgi:SAM-dependent methyltransferase